MVLHSDCPVCNGGRIGFRVTKNGETLILMCDDCAMVWTRPDAVDAEHAYDLLRPEFNRRFPGVSLDGSRWATTDQVLAQGWGAYIAALDAAPREVDEP